MAKKKRHEKWSEFSQDEIVEAQAQVPSETVVSSASSAMQALTLGTAVVKTLAPIAAPTTLALAAVATYGAAKVYERCTDNNVNNVTNRVLGGIALTSSLANPVAFSAATKPVAEDNGLIAQGVFGMAVLTTCILPKIVLPAITLPVLAVTLIGNSYYNSTSLGGAATETMENAGKNALANCRTLCRNFWNMGSSLFQSASRGAAL